MFIRNILGVGMAVGAVLADVRVRQNYTEDIFWIITHDFKLVTTRLDPVMNPGEVSTHAHAVMGGSNFGPNYDYDNLRQSQCTTARATNDMSNYWTPQMYHKNNDDTFSIANLKFAQTYYLMRRSADREPVYEFPAGFRMLAGDPSRRTLDLSDPAQDGIRYTCLGANLTETHEFPLTYCPAGVRAQAFFPHCWDGIHAWLEGSKHVAYGEGRYDGGGQCPPSHPKRIMGLFYEFVFEDVKEYKEKGRVWANGDDVGYSFHADFTNGWEVGFFQEVFNYGKECSVSFYLEDCPAFDNHYRGIDSPAPCPYSGVEVVEDVGLQGPIAKLPGNNPHADSYKEAASFNIGSPVKAAVASILATDIRMGVVKGDPSYSAPPDAVPQTGVVTSGYAQATSAVASGYLPIANKGVVTSAQPAASQATAAGPSNVASVVPGGGAVLIGESALPGAAYTSASTSASVPAAVASSVPASPPVAAPSVANPPAANPPAASVVVPANGGTAEEMSGGSSVPVPAPAPTQEAIPPKECGRKGRKGGPYRSDM